MPIKHILGDELFFFGGDRYIVNISCAVRNTVHAITSQRLVYAFNGNRNIKIPWSDPLLYFFRQKIEDKFLKTILTPTIIRIKFIGTAIPDLSNIEEQFFTFRRKIYANFVVFGIKNTLTMHLNIPIYKI